MDRIYWEIHPFGWLVLFFLSCVYYTDDIGVMSIKVVWQEYTYCDFSLFSIYSLANDDCLLFSEQVHSYKKNTQLFQRNLPTCRLIIIIKQESNIINQNDRFDSLQENKIQFNPMLLHLMLTSFWQHERRKWTEAIAKLPLPNYHRKYEVFSV